jgi:predicted neutral ceramidase superfamily lipid hydrolase
MKILGEILWASVKVLLIMLTAYNALIVYMKIAGYMFMTGIIMNIFLVFMGAIVLYYAIKCES